MRLEADQMWSYVHKKRNPSWLCWVEDHDRGEIVTFLFGRRANVRAYHNLLPTEIHQEGKDQTQRIERKHRTSDPIGLANPHQAVSPSNHLFFQI